MIDQRPDLLRERGEQLGDLVGAPPSASRPHDAAPVAHAAHPSSGPDLFGGMLQRVGDLGRGFQQEGLGALLDPYGAVDRQDAQRDLADRFNVVAPGAGGATAPNTVSPDEFEAIARQYSNIRMNRSDVRIDTAGMSPAAAAEHRARTMEDIGDLLQTESGRGLIGDLDHGALDADGTTRRITRIGRASDVDSAKGGGDWDTPREHKQGYVDYIPGENHLPSSTNARSDVTLFHELTHAHHSTRGTFAHGPIGPGTRDVPTAPQDVDESRSEYQSVGIGEFANERFTENAYRRERMAIGASGAGVRTLGGSDVDLEERATYNVPGTLTSEPSDHDH